MAVLELLDQVSQVEIGSVRLDGTVVRSVIEEAEPDSNPDQAKTARLVYSYRVPFPGVRYYSYEELIL